ncbi:CD1375 family protein [Exiguobacterium sp. KRL4]|nr:CD1375 family protein [Exiguobacterium sp. KRL4]
MAQVYANLIIKGMKALEEVPKSLQNEVEALLHETAG